ncbi:glycosyltransferase family 4 protein [Clostridium butyricum]|uniref:glycosyltransferase family 4 protein n=1 Tax=Clostridium butyricum TaxID=1492 RepID=UPI00071E9EA2|nr:glycosyltransferase [Clostridium butyricum]ALS18157.1 hypothetical protein ATD26_15070 [Clostridium butyricum]MDM8132254.1 glycosyltransferase [Clostridium butyricum]MDM8230709.1 glycosyltransferase [Clostridium butyricum]
MKILIIRNYPTYIDLNCNTYNIQEVGLAKALIRKGHQCDIVFWTKENKENKVITFDDGLSFTVFYRQGINILKNAVYIGIDELIKKYNIIQVCEYNQLQSWILSKKYKEKIIIYHGPYYSEFNKKYNLMCKIFDILFLNRYKKLRTNFIVKSELAKEFLINKGINERNVINVGVGIDLDALSNRECNEQPEFIKNIDKYEKDLKLLYIGKIEPRRNITFIYDTLNELSKRGEKVKLIMVGNGEKEYTEECNQYAKKIGVDNLIYSIPKLEQKYLSELYKKADFFVLPTHYEIFGMVLLEAMYYGLPVLTTLNGGSDCLINNWENGIILECNTEKWTSIILKLNNNRQSYLNMSSKASDTIKNQYTWEKVSEKMLISYEKLVN